MSKPKDPDKTEINEPTSCPYCGHQLDRLSMARVEPDGAPPRWHLIVAGTMNATALTNIAKLMKGWATG